MAFEHTADAPYEPTGLMLERAMRMVELHPRAMWSLTVLDLIERLEQTDAVLRRFHGEVGQELLKRGVTG
jgi:hypothetical protein